MWFLFEIKLPNGTSIFKREIGLNREAAEAKLSFPVGATISVADSGTNLSPEEARGLLGVGAEGRRGRDGGTAQPFQGRSVAEQAEPRAAFSNFIRQFGFEPGGPQTLGRRIAGEQAQPFQRAFELSEALGAATPGDFNAQLAQFFGGQTGLDPQQALRSNIQQTANLAQTQGITHPLVQATVNPTSTFQAEPFLNAVRELAFRRVSPLIARRLQDVLPTNEDFFGDLLAQQNPPAGGAVTGFTPSALTAFGFRPRNFGFAS